jgi:hypothetical protein
LQPVEEGVGFFAIAIKDRQARDRARARELAAWQFYQLFVGRGLDLQVVGARAGDRDRNDDAGIDEGNPGVGLIGLGAVMDLVVVFVFFVTEFKDRVLAVVGR